MFYVYDGDDDDTHSHSYASSFMVTWCSAPNFVRCACAAIASAYGGKTL